jgi:ribosomal protein S2
MSSSSISTRRVDFSSNLILLDSKDIDIILDMDWLRKYDRVIQCGKKIVRLTKEDGTTIEFVATKQSNQASTVNQAKVAALEEIRVV